MRALLPSLLLLGAVAAHAQSQAPDAPAPVPVPTRCTESAPASQCQCRHGVSSALSDAKFPRAAAKAGVHSGKVVLSFVISSTGEATNIETIESTHDFFAEEAKRLVGRIRCHPEAAGTRVTLPFTFKLE